MPRPFLLVSGALALASTAGLAAAAYLAALEFYVRAKAALAEPVRFGEYAAANKALIARGTRRGEAGAVRMPRVVLIGDSTISRWPFDGRSQGWEIVNRGIAGETSAQLVYRFPVDALALKPDVVVVQTGVNDLVAASLLEGPRGEAIAGGVTGNLQRIAREGVEAGVPVLLITLVPPSRPELLRRPVWSSRIYAQVQGVNEALLAWEAPAGVTVVDHRGMFGGDAILPVKYAADALHFDEAGYALFEKLVADNVRKVLPSRTAIRAN